MKTYISFVASVHMVISILTSGCAERAQHYFFQNLQVRDTIASSVGQRMVSWESGKKTVTSVVEGVRCELIYAGIAHDVVSVTYREYSATLPEMHNRPLLSSDLRYDISQSRRITFRNYELEVDTANSSMILFHVLQAPSTDEYVGFGTVGMSIDPKHVVLNVQVNGPAYRAGIRVGDEIVRVDGLDVREVNFLDVNERVKGPPGTKVYIVVKRGENEFGYDISRR